MEESAKKEQAERLNIFLADCFQVLETHHIAVDAFQLWEEFYHLLETIYGEGFADLWAAKVTPLSSIFDTGVVRLLSKSKDGLFLEAMPNIKKPLEKLDHVSICPICRRGREQECK
jgi:hypothetical protein